jgi:thiol-disulfide isomerase/thioredoxin
MTRKHVFIAFVSILLTAVLQGGCSRAPSAVAATPEEIQAQIAAVEAPLVLVHAWATWCEPCREEFPDLMQAVRRYRGEGLAVLLVSADDPADQDLVEAFLAQHESPVDSLISTELNQRFIESLSPNWSGALPATFIFSDAGECVSEWEGKRSLAHYQDTIETLLKQTKGATP